MDSSTIPPAACRTMAQVREGVDQVDRAILALLAQRFGYMEAAARIKADRESVRDEQRKAEVLANVAALAGSHAIPVEPVVALYDALIEASIAYEFERFDDLRAGEAAASGR